MKPKSKNLKPGITGIGVTVSQAVFQFLVLSVLALKFGIEVVGQFSFINAILIVVFMLFSFGLRQAFVLENKKYGYSSFYYLRVVSLIIGSFICFSIILLINKELIMLFFPLCLYRITELLSELQWADYQSKKQFNSILISQGGRYTLCSLIFILISFITNDIYFAMWGYALSGLFYVLITDGKNIFQNIKNDDKDIEVFKCFKEFYPLSISLTSMSIQNNGTRFFLGLFGGDYFLGLFSIAYQLFNMPYMIFMAAFNFYLKKTKTTELNTQVTLKHLYLISFIFTMVTAIFWLLFGGLIVDLFFGEDFQKIVMPVFFLLLFTLFRYMAYCHQWKMMNNGHYKRIAKHQVLLSILISISSFVLVYFYQYNGAYAALASSCLLYYTYFLLLAKNESK
jgi:O-antigen/teichoic acid export membrane protein